jgi:hypothetical protein
MRGTGDLAIQSAFRGIESRRQTGGCRSRAQGYGSGRFIVLDVVTAMLSSSKFARRLSLPSEDLESVKPAFVCEAARKTWGAAANELLSARAQGFARNEVAPGWGRGGERDADGADFLARHSACAARSVHLPSEAPVADQKFW